MCLDPTPDPALLPPPLACPPGCPFPCACPAAHAGHVTFKWQDEAEKNNRRLNHARAQSSPEEAWSSAAVRAAFNIDRRPTRDYKSTAAVQDTATLLPSKIKELGELGCRPWSAVAYALRLEGAQRSSLMQCADWQLAGTQHMAAHSTRQRSTLPGSL